MATLKLATEQAVEAEVGTGSGAAVWAGAQRLLAAVRRIAAAAQRVVAPFQIAALGQTGKILVNAVNITALCVKEKAIALLDALL